MISTISEYVQKAPQLALYAEHMNTRRIQKTMGRYPHCTLFWRGVSRTTWSLSPKTSNQTERPNSDRSILKAIQYGFLALRTINYTTLLRKGLSPSMCPADTYFLHKPLSFWELNKYFIMGSLSFIFLLALFFFYHIHNLNIIKSIIENNNTLLLQLISDILDLSKIEAGTLDFNYSNVEINDLMSDLENSCQLKLKSDKVKLEFIAPEQPCCAYIEKNRLSQLIINFVTNAIKFTTEGSIRFGFYILVYITL